MTEQSPCGPLQRIVSRHRGLSDKSLKMVWAWAEQNEGISALADAYMQACVFVGALDPRKISDELKPLWPSGKYGHIDEAWIPYHCGFFLRDSIGRVILRMLKRRTDMAANKELCGESAEVTCSIMIPGPVSRGEGDK